MDNNILTGIEDALAEYGSYACTIFGTSMLPMLRPQKDVVVIKKSNFPLNRFDVVLYLKENAKTYTLHRIIAVKDEFYIIRGDNSISKEYINKGDIIGVLSGFYRSNKYIDINNLLYKAFVRIWFLITPFRITLKRGKLLLIKIKRYIIN